MPTTYKEKLIKEIEDLPDEVLQKFYLVIHTMKMELMPKSKKTKRQGSLRGIWKGSQIDESLFREAKESLFPYERK